MAARRGPRGSRRAGAVRRRHAHPPAARRARRRGRAAVHAVHRHPGTVRRRDGRTRRRLERRRRGRRVAPADHRSDHEHDAAAADPRPSGGRPRRCCTTTSTAGCALRPCWSSPSRSATTELPATDVDELATWFRTAAHSGSLVRYLEPFAHTVGVMQTPEALHRVAFECVEDLAADSVVYAEVRFAPELHIDGGLSLDAVVDAVLAGFADGEKAAAAGAADHRALSGHRHAARRAVTRDRRAGDPVPRQGRGRIRHRRRRGGLSADPAPRRVRVHAEQQRALHRFTRARRSGLPSIHEAIAFCGADRLGHGVRIVDDIDDRCPTARVHLGRLASILRDKRIPLEMCPSSNVQTGAVGSIAEHPFDCWRAVGSGSPSTPTTG